jgi:hypothetical protein
MLCLWPSGVNLEGREPLRISGEAMVWPGGLPTV